MCLLTLKTPVDLSAHDSVTFSFYRWIDEGVGDNEFLGVDVGDNGQYQRLETWNKQHADGQWHRETFTLSGDQIGDATSIRFFAISGNAFTTFAIDNVLISATPGTVVVTPEPEPEEDRRTRPRYHKCHRDTDIRPTRGPNHPARHRQERQRS